MTSFLFLDSFLKFIYLFGCTGSLLLGAGLRASHGMGFFAVVRGLLIAVASLLVEHRDCGWDGNGGDKAEVAPASPGLFLSTPLS